MRAAWQGCARQAEPGSLRPCTPRQLGRAICEYGTRHLKRISSTDSLSTFVKLATTAQTTPRQITNWLSARQSPGMSRGIRPTGTSDQTAKISSLYSITSRHTSPGTNHPQAASGKLHPTLPTTQIQNAQKGCGLSITTRSRAWTHGQKTRVDELKKAGLYEETIIVFFSDHGVGLPRAKRWVYNAGIQVPMIIRIPEKFRVAQQGTPNSTSTDLVSMIDMGPTTLNLAGVPIHRTFRGIPFLGENLPPKRTHLFAARDRIDNRYDFVRSVRDERFIYIKNFTPWKPYAQHVEYCEKGAMMQELRSAHDKGTPVGSRRAVHGSAPPPKKSSTIFRQTPTKSTTWHHLRNIAPAL